MSPADERKPLPEHWKLRTGLPEAHHDDGALFPPMRKKELPAGPRGVDLPAPEKELDLPEPARAAALPEESHTASAVAPVVIPPMPIVIVTPAAPASVVVPVMPPSVVLAQAPSATIPVLVSTPSAPELVSAPPVLEQAAVFFAPVVLPQTQPPKAKPIVVPVPHAFTGSIEHPAMLAPQIVPLATRTPALNHTVAAVYTQPLGRADEWLPWMRTSQWLSSGVAARIGAPEIKSAHAGLPAVIKSTTSPVSERVALSRQPVKGKLETMRVGESTKLKHGVFLEHARKSTEELPGMNLEEVIEARVKQRIERIEKSAAVADANIEKVIAEQVARRVEEKMREVEEKLAGAPLTPPLTPLESIPAHVPEIVPANIPLVSPSQKTVAVSADDILRDALKGFVKKGAPESEGLVNARPVVVERVMEAPSVEASVQITPTAPTVEISAAPSREVVEQVRVSAVDSWDDELFGIEKK